MDASQSVCGEDHASKIVLLAKSMDASQSVYGKDHASSHMQGQMTRWETSRPQSGRVLLQHNACCPYSAAAKTKA